MGTVTYTRTHTFITFANPFLTCDQCGVWVASWHDNDRCGCDASCWNEPCGHNACVTSVCPSWGPVDGCQCREHLGNVPHARPDTTGDPATAFAACRGCATSLATCWAEGARCCDACAHPADTPKETDRA